MPNSAQNKTAPAANTGPHLHIEDVGEFKWQWVKAAQKRGMKLAVWVVHALNAAAAATEAGKGPGKTPPSA